MCTFGHHWWFNYLGPLLNVELEFGCHWWFNYLGPLLNVELEFGCHWWFNYLGPLLNVELEFACLSGEGRLVAFVLYCLDSTQPAELPQ